jgi:hypothetical protein
LWITIEAQAYKDVLVIDDFTVASNSYAIIVLTTPAPVTQSVFDSGNGILGTERDVVLTVTSGNPSTIFVAACATDGFRYSNPNHGTSVLNLQYDGNDASDTLGNGLSVDLTKKEAQGFRINMISDLATTIEITVVDSSDNSASIQIAVPGSLFSASVFADFIDFDNNIDFSSVTAIQLTCQGGDGFDAAIQSFTTYSSLSSSTATFSAPHHPMTN